MSGGTRSSLLQRYRLPVERGGFGNWHNPRIRLLHSSSAANLLDFSTFSKWLSNLQLLQPATLYTPGHIPPVPSLPIATLPLANNSLSAWSRPPPPPPKRIRTHNRERERARSGTEQNCSLDPEIRISISAVKSSP